MKMASRNIANMHLFLEMKTKFPYLPEETLRKNVYLYAQDQAKCLNLLQKESENHFHPSQQFSDFRQIEHKINFKINENIKGNSDSAFEPTNLNVSFQANRDVPNNNANVKNSNHTQDGARVTSDQNMTNSEVINSSNMSTNFFSSSKPEIHSAPVLKNFEKPFVNMFKSIPDSSHCSKQIPRDQNYHNRMMFSTTKEHFIQTETASNITPQPMPNSNNVESSKRHAVELSITPTFPFQQQQMNVYSNAVCATASHSSRPGRHTTSLNFQLQSPSSDQFPLEISTVPTYAGRPCNYRDFGSHVQISVGSQGTTFTALRLQRPVQNHSSNQTPSDEVCNNYSLSPSHALNSKSGPFPTSPQDNSGSSIKGRCCSQMNHYSQSNTVSVDGHQFSQNSHSQPEQSNRKEFKHLNSNNNSFQATDYIKAVKTHQRAQLNIVEEDLSKAKLICSKLKSEINKLELDLLKRKETNSCSYMEVIKRLREDNRQLRLECNCLLMEYDLCSKGQIPVGVTDEDFYSNIFTGPNNGLALSSHSGENFSKAEIPSQPVQAPEDDDDEKNSWKCKKCTFVNHPALEKCEICEISKHSGSFFDES